MRKRRKEPHGKARMDMTPMIDVTFLLLIFFLCLEFKTLEGKLGSNLPRDRGTSRQAAQPREDLELRILTRTRGRRVPDETTRGRYELAGHTCKWRVGAREIQRFEELARILRANSTRRVPSPDGTGEQQIGLKIKHGDGVTYGDVTQVLDLAMDCGFENIVFAASPRE